MEFLKKLESLQNVETFEEELAMVDSPEDMQKLIARHGVDLTLEEVRDFVAYAAKASQCEFTEEELDSVAGGAWYVEVGKFVVDQVAKWFVKKGLDRVFKW